MTVWARWHRTRRAQQLICGLDVICLCLHAGGSEAALTAAAYRASSHQWGWQRITARQRQIPTIIWLMSRQRWARVIHTAGTEVVTPQEEDIKNPCIPKWMPSLLNKVFFFSFWVMVEVYPRCLIRGQATKLSLCPQVPWQQRFNDKSSDSDGH